MGAKQATSIDVFPHRMTTEESQGLPWAAWDPAKTNADILCSDAAGRGVCASHRVRNTEIACSRTYGVSQGRTRPGSSTTSTTREYAKKKRRLSRSITLHHPYRSVPTQARTRFRTSPPGAVRDLAAPRSGPKIDPPLVPPPTDGHCPPPTQVCPP